MNKVLLVCSEIYPLLKTGGLADFAYSYSRALSAYADTVVLVPGFRALLEKAGDCEVLYTYPDAAWPTRLLAGRIPGSQVPLWIVDCPALFDRSGNPYLDESGAEYSDSPQRFNHFCQVAVDIALGRLGLHWQPNLVHCNDWHTGMIPAWLSPHPEAPATVFSIHNLAYQGNYPGEVFDQLQIPGHWRDYQHLEYHGQLSFIKGGLVFADMITTVSPGYAEDIQTETFGCGLQGLLQHRREHLAGILNGVDYDVWNPASDPCLPLHYNSEQLENKTALKLQMQQACGLASGRSWLCAGFIGRLVHQKGIEQLLQAMRANLDHKIQWLIVGTGDAPYEQQLRQLAAQYPERIHVTIGYDEALAHRVEAAADVFVMPSNYEPCGLNQLYSLKYGTVPIVSRTGGLRDSVVPCSKATLADGSATGFLFEPGNGEQLLAVLEQASRYFKNKTVWRALQRQGMNRDFGWLQSVQQYLQVYRRALQYRHPHAAPVETPAITLAAR